MGDKVVGEDIAVIVRGRCAMHECLVSEKRAGRWVGEEFWDGILQRAGSSNQLEVHAANYLPINYRDFFEIAGWGCFTPIHW